jgi:hypothetical protein
MSEEDKNTETNAEEKPAKKLSPLEAVKQRQAEMRQGLKRKSQGVNLRDDGTGAAGGHGADTPKQQNSPRRQGGS